MSVTEQRAPVLLASGRDADVFDLGDGRVLRRYRYAATAATERAVMAHVGRHGLAVPRVLGGTGPELLMTRIDGPTLLAALLSGDVAPERAGEILAELHEQLHRIPALTNGETVVHLDLHPDNVLLGPDGPVVIDWTTAQDGDAGLDLAVTAVILAEAVPVEPMAAAILGAFLDGIGDVGRAAVRHSLAAAVDRRRRNPTLTSAEKAQLDAAADVVRRSPK
jgi:aminoglycoside phosphotransferase (APT) family kinase protein